jgi:hypothetical protein
MAMFRPTIRDLLLLTIIAGVVFAWRYDRAMSNHQVDKPEPQVYARDLFPPGREGLIAAMQNEKRILNYRVAALVGELENRGHKVAITGAGVFVDTPAVP